MPKIFTTLDKIKPAYDITYKVVLFICKILLIADILITTMSDRKSTRLNSSHSV